MTTRQRRQGFGRIEQLKSKRWRAAYVGPDGVLYRASQTFDTKGDGQAWLSRRRAEISMEVWQPEVLVKKRATEGDFRSYSAKWLRERDLKPRTMAHYRHLLDVHLMPTFGDLSLHNISADLVATWYETAAKGRPTTKSHAYGLLRTILGTATQARLISYNPVHIRGAGRTRPVHKTKPASLTELEKIVAGMPQRYQAMTILAAWCAMRFGELIELRRSDIDVSAQVVKVRRAATFVNGETIVGMPKSDAGTRDVAIPPHVVPMIKSHLARHVDQDSEALLFPARSGDHMKPSTLYRVFYPAREAAGRPDLRFHDLRHTGAVLAAQTGATLAELMGRLGHSTPQAALRYQHVAAGRDTEIAKRLSQLAAS